MRRIKVHSSKAGGPFHHQTGHLPLPEYSETMCLSRPHLLLRSFVKAALSNFLDCEARVQLSSACEPVQRGFSLFSATKRLSRLRVYNQFITKVILEKHQHLFIACLLLFACVFLKERHVYFGCSWLPPVTFNAPWSSRREIHMHQHAHIRSQWTRG